MSIDPATKDKQENDPSGIVVSKVTEDGAVYIVHAMGKKYLPNALVDEVFNLVSIYNPDVVSIETVSAQILWLDLFNYEMQKRGVRFRLEPYDPGTKVTKPVKIRKLIPFYARGQVFHKPGLTELEKQLREFPRNKNDDIIDALQAQCLYWKGRTISVKKQTVKYTAEWWDELRRINTGSGTTAEKNLFKEYGKPTKPVTLRKPNW